MVISTTNRVGPSLRRTLAQGSALAAVLAMAATSAHAADIPQGGTVVNLPGPGSPSVSISLDGDPFGPTNVTNINNGRLPSTTIDVGIEVQQAKTVINWNEFNIGAGRSVNFSAASGITNYAVLNRVVDSTATATQILGALTSTAGGQIWVLNRAGVIFGATARIDTGSFVASALNITDANFGLADTGSSFSFTRPIDGNAARQLTIDGAAISVASGAIIGNVANTGPVLLVAPVISSAGAVRAGGDVGFVVAQAATVELSSTSILSIQIDAGTSLAANKLDLLTGSTANGARVFAVAAAQVDPVAALLNVQGNITATRASVGENGIVLSAGADAGGVSGVTVVEPTNVGDPANVRADVAIGGGALLTSANNVVVAANRDVLLGGTASIANGLATGASRIDADRDVQISGTGAIVAAGAPLTITAARDIHLVGERVFNAVTTLDATRNVLIDTLTGTTRFAADATFTAGQDVVVDSTETLSLDADARFEATGDVSITLPTVTATGTLAVVAGTDATVIATAGDAVVDSGEATAGNLTVQATGDASLATGVAGTDLLLLGNNATSTTSLTAGDDVAVVARAGNATTVQVVATGLGADSEADDAAVLSDATGGTINDPTKAAATALNGLAGSNVLVIASGDASVTGASASASTAARDLRVVAGDTSSARLNNGTATRDLLLLGGSAASSGTLTAGDDVTVVARAGNAVVTTVVATGLAASTEANDATVLTDASGGTINDPTKGAATALNRLAGSNALVIGSADAQVFGSSVSSAARDLRVVAGDASTAFVQNGTATRDLLLLGGTAASNGTLTAGDDVIVVARAGNVSLTIIAATGLGTDSEANDASLLTDASGATINDPTKAVATALIGFAGSNALAIASGSASVAFQTASTAARDLRVVAGDTSRAFLNNGTAGRDLLLLGGSAESFGTLMAGDDVVAVARAGKATIDTVIATGLGTDTEAGDATVPTDASGGTINDPTKAAATALVGFAGSNALVIASGNASVTGGIVSTAARDLRVVAGDAATAVLRNGTATRDLLLLGGSAQSTGTLTAGDDVIVVARAGTALLSTVVSTGLGTDTEAGDATVLTDASSGTINDPTKSAATALNRLGGSNALVIASGDASVTGATVSTAARDIRVVAGNTALATLNNGTATRDLLLLGGSAASSGTLTAGDDVTVVARAGNADVTTVVATGLAASSEANDATALTDASGGTINDPTKAAATALTRFAGSNALVIASVDAQVSGATVSTAARDLRVVAGNTAVARLNNGTATRDLLLLGGVAASTGTLTAGDDVTVVARGPVLLQRVVATGLGLDSETNDSTVLTDASDGTISDPTKGGAMALIGFAGSNALVIAGGSASVTSGTASSAARDLRVVAGNASFVRLDNGTAGRDLLLLGDRVSSTGTLTAGDDVVVVARAGNALLSTAVANGMSAVDSETNDSTLLTDASGGTINDPTKAAATPLIGFAGSNALVIASGGVQVIASTAARDLRVVAGDSATAALGNGTATRDLLLLGGNVSSNGTLTAGDDVIVVARAGNAVVPTIVATGLGTDSEANDASLLTDASGGTINDPTKAAATALTGFAGSNALVIASADAAVTGAPVSTAARDLRVVAGDTSTAFLNDGTATRDLLLLGGSASSTGTLTAGDDVVVVARAGNATLATVVATGLGADTETDDATLLADASGGTINDPTKAASSLIGFAGSNVLVIASGDASVAGAGATLSTAARDLRVIAGDTSLARLANGTAGRDLLLLGDRASSTGTLTAGDDIVVVARAGNAVLTTVVANGTSAVDTETADSTLLSDASGGTINDPTKAAATALTGFAGSNALVIASGDASVSGATVSTAARDLRVVAGDAATAFLNNGTATRDLLLLGGSTSSTGTLTAGDDVVVVARAGNATLATVVATGLGVDTETDDATLLADASGGTINDPTKAAATALTGFAGSNALVIASADAAVTGATVSTAARDLRVVAGDAATAFLNNGTATRDLLLLGGSASSTGTLTAGDDVVVVARTGAAGLTNVVATGLGVDSETDDATLLTDASGGTINDPTKAAASSLIGFAGSNVLVIASGDASVAGAGATLSTAARDLRVVAGDTSLARLANGTAGRDLLLLGGRASSTGTLTAGDDIVVVARAGNAVLTTVVANGTSAVDTETDDSTLLSDASGGTINDPTKAAATALVGFAGSNVVVVASGDATVTGGSSSMAARDLRVVAGNASLARLNNGTAGRDLLLLGGSAASDAVLRAGDDLAVVARGGTATVGQLTATGAGGDSEAGDATALFDASGAAIANPAAGSGAGDLARLTGSNIVVAASGAVTANTGTVFAANDVRLASGAGVLFGDARAGRDLLVVGTTVDGTDAQAGDDVALVARSGAVSVATLTATGLGLNAVTGANLGTAAADNETDAAGLAGLANGSTIADPTKGVATALTRFAGNNALAIGATTATVTTATAPRDVRVVAGDASLAMLTNGTAGRDLLLLGGSAASGGSLSAGDDLAVVARGGTATVGQLTATGAGSDSEAGDATALLDASGGAINDPTKVAPAILSRFAGSNALVIASGDASVSSGAESTATRDLRVVAGDAAIARLNNGSAGRDLLLLGGTAVSNASLTAGDDVTVVALSGSVTVNAAGLTAIAGADSESGSNAAVLRDASNGAVSDPYSWHGNASVDTLGGRNIVLVGTTGVTASTIGDNAAITARAVTAGGSSNVDNATAANLVLVGTRNPAGTASLNIGVSGGDIIVAGGGFASLVNGNAGNDIIVSGGSATLVDGTAGNDIFVLASSGDASIGVARTLGTSDGSDTAGGALIDEFNSEVISGVTGRRIDRIDGSNIIVEAQGNVNAGTLSTALGSGRDIRVGALGTADVTTAGALRDVVVSAGSSASGTTLVAGRDVTVLGASATFDRLLAGDDVAVVARNGAADITTARAFGFDSGVNPINGGSFGVPFAPVVAGNEVSADAVLFDLALNPVTDPSSTGAISGLAGANIFIAGSAGATLGTGVAATDLKLVAATGVAALTDGRAGQDMLVLGDSVAVTTLAAAGDDLALVARAGGIVLGDAVTLNATGQVFDAGTAVFSGAVGGGLSSEASDATALIGLSGNAISDPTKAGALALVGFGGSNIVVVASGNVVVPQASAPRDVRVVAGTDATLTTGVAGRDLLLLAGGNAAGTTLTAGDDLAVVARGGTAMVGQLTATGAGSDSETGDATALFDASGAAISNPAAGSGAGDIARLSGSNIVVAASGAVTANTGTVFAANDVRLASGAGVLFGDARAGRDLLVVGTTVDGTDAQAGDDVALVARTGAVSVATLTATGLGLNAVTGANLGTAAADSETDAAGLAGLANGSTIADPTKGVATALTRFAGNNALAIGATTATVTTATALRDVRVVAGGDASLTTGVAGRDLLLLAGNNATSATSLTAGDDVVVVARGGTATVGQLTATGAGVDSETGDATALFDASGAPVGNPAAGTGLGDIARLAGSNIVVTSVGAITADTGTAFAATDVRLASGAGVLFGDARAGRDLLVVGTKVGGSNAQAGDDVALVARDGAVTVTTLASTGVGLNALTGANLAAAATNGDTDAGGLAGLTSGSVIFDPTKGTSSALTGFAGNNVLAIGSTTVTVATAMAPRDVRVVAGTNAALATGTAGRDLLLLAGGAATSATRLTAGDDVVVVARGGDAIVAMARATGMGGDSETADTTMLADASGAVINDPSVPASPPALSGLALSNVLVTASGNATVADAQAPRDIRVAAAGDVRLTTGVATTRNITLAAGGVAGANRLTAGGNLNVTASDIDLFSVTTPVALAPLVSLTGTTAGTGAALLTVRNRNGATAAATSAVVIGDVTSPPASAPTPATSWTLNNAELGAIQATSIDIAAGARTVTIGTATPFTATTGTLPRVARFGVETTGTINVVGVLGFNGAGRVLTLGGRTADAENAGTPTADVIRVVAAGDPTGATPQPNGQILADGGAVRLRSRVISIGQQELFQSQIAPGGAPIAQSLVVSNFFVNTQSSLYRAIPGYVRPTTPPAAQATYLRASTLALTVGDYAIFQNTGVQIQPGGGSVLGAVNLYSSTPDNGAPTIAIFGSINGRDGVAASLQAAQITLNGISPINVRVNGCIALQGSGCVVSNFAIPDPRLANPSSAFLLTVAPSLTLPIDLVSGATNEALWRTERCEETDKPCPKPESNR